MAFSLDEVEREDSVHPADDADGLAQRLQQWARSVPAREACVALDGHGRRVAALTYAAFALRVRAVAAVLQAHAQPGDRALLVFDAGLEFGVALFACFSAGMIAVPAPAPRSAATEAADMLRLKTIADDAAPRFVLSDSTRIASIRNGIANDLPPMHWLAVDMVDDAEADAFAEEWPSASSLAILQYTSGSTDEPRGVEITHANLAAMSAILRERFAHGETDTVVSWLPHFHDMGLVGGIIHTVFIGGRLVVLSPTTFLKRPQVWLQAISEYGAVTAGGPNFAYEHCLRRIHDPQSLGIDLSRWRAAFNGAEPLRAATLARFTDRFASCGFREEAFLPCYGLAEATLCVTSAEVREKPRIRDGAPALVSSGTGVPGQRLRIVDPENGTICRDGESGEIWLAGPHVGRGYYGKPEATRATFGARTANGEGPFLRTGDLGFIDAGQLFVIGRLKELIIIDGRNLYPQEIEATVDAVHGAILRSAAISTDGVDGERLVIVAESDGRALARDGMRAADLERAIRMEIAASHDVAPYAVVLVPRGTIGRTTSGKVQRVACRTAYLEGRLGGTV